MTDQPEPEDLTGAWTPDPPIGCLLPDRTTPDNPPTSSNTADNSLRQQIAAAIESEMYEYRERSMFWPETGGITEEIARLATRGAMEVRDREMDQLRAKITDIDHIINWHTTCASCARILDSAYAETMRAETAETALARVQALVDEHPVAVGTHLLEEALDQSAPAAPEATELGKTARVLAALHQSAEETVTRVTALHEQWVKAGPPPLGTPIARWWDRRLAEHHDAIRPPRHDTGPGVAEAAADDRRWPLERDGE